MKALTLLLGLICCMSFSLENATVSEMHLNYIDLYKDIAISEMHRSGIPASIKLAQGLLESQAGQSSLAQNANNHFGIKCKSTWSGPSFYKEDDDYDASGSLMESCFRAYDFAEQSYRDHSDFLVHRERYKSLFSYGNQDYVNWAIGLSRCGYATDKKYAQKVISTIQKWGLDQYDKVEMPVREKATEIMVPKYKIPAGYRPGDGLK